MGLLEHQVALITGAGQGIGLAIAHAFAAEGAAVAILEREAARAKAACANLQAHGFEARAFPIDITDYEAYAHAVDEILAWKGQIDTLVNNAGIWYAGTILTDTLADWRSTMTVNLEAVYMGTKLVAPHMAHRQRGRIINIASIAAYASRGNVSAYNASKGAVVAYTKSLAVELGRYNILVNAIAPGLIHTPMLSAAGDDETTTPAFQEWYLNRGKIPLRRVGQPQDIAGVAVFLASDYCRYMTGETLIVDGGLMSTF
ncbi:MAG: SDR family NAD(P)-dependent oxidoreductase [Aggregatilineales bacterium]